MKRLHLLVLAGVAVLFVCAEAKVEWPEPEKALLIGKGNPMLAGIDKLCVVLEPPDGEPNKAPLVWKALNAKVEARLKEAGVDCRGGSEIDSAGGSGLAELRINVDMLELGELRQYVFHIQTSLAARFYLEGAARHFVKAGIWQTGAVMESVPAESVADKVTKVVLGQLETFINCYHIANPNGVPACDANAIAVWSVEPVVPVVGKSAKYEYVCSRNSDVFHRPDCPWARRIKPENLIGFGSRQEAIMAGKRPCKRCQP